MTGWLTGAYRVGVAKLRGVKPEQPYQYQSKRDNA
jgi:hypothetical protein